MSSEKEKAFARLEELLRPKLEELKTLVQKKTEIVKEMAQIIEDSRVMGHEWISSFLKWLFEREHLEVSDATIERACGPLRKQKTKPMKKIGSTPIIDAKKEIEVSTSGFEEPESEPEQAPTAREVLETSTEIAMTLAEQYARNSKELEARLNEALQLADDKDKRMHQLMLEIGEKEMVIEDLKKQPPAPNKDIDTTEDLQIEIDSMKQTITELQEALRANVKASGFTQASHLPKQVWIAAINAINFYRELNKASRYCIEHNDPWKKIIFEVASDGQLKAAKLDE